MTYDENIFSDLHKDVHGFRPRGHEFYDAAPARKQQIWDQLVAELAEQIVIDEEIQRDAVVAFECEVAAMVRLGARDRLAALSWICDANDLDSSDPWLKERVEIEYNLPEGYVAAGL